MNTCMKCAHKNVCEWCIDDSDYDFPTCSDFLEERPQGEWIYHKGLSESRECSVCGVWLDWSLVRNSFCPNCGADMRVKDELKGG